jgi:hypothetical protein
MIDRPADIDGLTQELRNLRLRIDQLEGLLLSAQHAPVPHTAPSAGDDALTINGIAVGDRVRVKNKVKKPAT